METFFAFGKVNKMVNCDGDACRIDAVITMDIKGQIVLPKDLREKANFKPNDKIAVVACEKEGEVCCIMMIKAERLIGAVTKTLAPLLKGVTNQES
jgi:AbrB family looped-hinge helix DNA binding protein